MGGAALSRKRLHTLVFGSLLEQIPNLFVEFTLLRKKNFTGQCHRKGEGGDRV
jgi:hypothetical protein